MNNEHPEVTPLAAGTVNSHLGLRVYPGPAGGQGIQYHQLSISFAYAETFSTKQRVIRSHV